MYALIWMPEHGSAGDTLTTHAVRIDGRIVPDVGLDGTLTLHRVSQTRAVPRPRPSAPALNPPLSIAPDRWHRVELFEDDGTPVQVHVAPRRI